IVNVALQRPLSDIGDGAGDHPGPELRGILAHSRKALGRLVLVVKFREVPAVLAGNRGPEARGVVQTLLESRKSLQHISGPADRLAELAVADDIDADLGL